MREWRRWTRTHREMAVDLSEKAMEELEEKKLI